MCCSQFAYHHVIAQITVSHFVSIIFCFIMKKAPLHPLLSGLGGCTPPLVNLQLAMQFLIMIKGDVIYFKSQGNVIYFKSQAAAPPV
jgi:hypothetical protein